MKLSMQDRRNRNESWLTALVFHTQSRGNSRLVTVSGHAMSVTKQCTVEHEQR